MPHQEVSCSFQRLPFIIKTYLDDLYQNFIEFTCSFSTEYGRSLNKDVLQDTDLSLCKMKRV